MKDWGDVSAFALTLPDAAESTSFGQPAVKVNGKPFISTGREAGSFVVHTSLDEKAVLIETDPETFWQTAHYRNWPALLVRYGSKDPARVKLVIRRAWWDRLLVKQLWEAGDRP